MREVRAAQANPMVLAVCRARHPHVPNPGKILGPEPRVRRVARCAALCRDRARFGTTDIPVSTLSCGRTLGGGSEPQRLPGGDFPSTPVRDFANYRRRLCPSFEEKHIESGFAPFGTSDAALFQDISLREELSMMLTLLGAT
jgi:hypothetical protein